MINAREGQTERWLEGVHPRPGLLRWEPVGSCTYYLMKILMPTSGSSTSGHQYPAMVPSLNPWISYFWKVCLGNFCSCAGGNSEGCPSFVEDDC
jgi:hypothetical protein